MKGISSSYFCSFSIIETIA